MGSFLLTWSTTWLSLSAVWFSLGATHRGQPWTPALMLPHVRYGLSVRRMTVLWTFSRPSMGRHVHRQFMRHTLACFDHYCTHNCLLPKKLRRDIQ
jgi:hypothetical protein